MHCLHTPPFSIPPSSTLLRVVPRTHPVCFAAMSSSFIHSAVFDPSLASPVASSADSEATYTTQPILPKEISGLTTFFSHFPPSPTPYILPPLPHPTLRLLFFISGSATLTQPSHPTQPSSFPLPADDMALFIPHPSHPLHILPSHSTLALELHWTLSPPPHSTDLADLPPSLPLLPYHRPYSSSPTYREAIKSPRTTSRTLLPPHLIPRMAMGSVHTTGPDRVAPHAHPMLEQLFVGLPGTRCVVRCDGVEAEMREGQVLHIPLGSEHGVSVNEGDILHYVWLDFFLTKEGAQWIADMHTDV